MAMAMTMSSLLGRTLPVRHASARPSGRGPLICMAKSPLALDQPKRLWETGNELW